MNPRHDRPGVVLDRYNEILAINEGLDTVKEKDPRQTDFIARNMGSIIVAAGVASAFLEGDPKPETSDVRVDLDELQTEIARTALKTLEQNTHDELQKTSAQEITTELEANLNLSRAIVNAREREKDN